jgi:hypothetical protein
VAPLVSGLDREDVAVVFQVSLKAVDGWWSKWLAGRREALVSQPRGGVGEHQAVRHAALENRPCKIWGL